MPASRRSFVGTGPATRSVYSAVVRVNREAARTVITAVLQLASTAAFNKTRNPDGHNHNHMDGGVTDGRGDGAVDDNTQGNTHA